VVQVELHPIDGELLALAELTGQVARSLDDATISCRVLAIADELRAMARGSQESTGHS
jgi:hypothetical protein